MKKSYCLYLSLFMMAAMVIRPACLSAQESRDSFEIGVEWYKQRAVEADSFQANPKYINNAIDAFEQSLNEQDHYEEAGTYLLKSYYFKGMFLNLEKEVQQEVFDKGRELGEKLEERFPKSVEIKFWYAANMGRWAKVHGFVQAATSGVAKKVRTLGEEIIDLDAQYQGGGGYRILAQAHFHSPKIPILMGWPSDKKALELVEKAMDIAPDHPTNRLLYAELLMSFGKAEEARKHLEYLLDFQPRPETLIPDQYVKHRASQLLKEKFEA